MDAGGDGLGDVGLWGCVVVVSRWGGMSAFGYWPVTWMGSAVGRFPAILARRMDGVTIVDEVLSGQSNVAGQKNVTLYVSALPTQHVPVLVSLMIHLWQFSHCIATRE